jgi:membrane protein CcdC involved in cytochrome C biogenesis
MHFDEEQKVNPHYVIIVLFFNTDDYRRIAMGHSLSANLPLTSTISMVVAACAIIFFRIRSTKKPTSARKIVIPPIGMSTGFLMFVYSPMRFPFVWGIAVFAVGAVLFSIPLILTSKFEQVGQEIYLRRSKAFIGILIVLLLLRLLLHSYVEEWVSIAQTAALFFVLAFGMLLPWRIAMYIQYSKLKKG